MTEGLVWSNTGLMVGIAVSAALAGQVIDARGASTAYWICVISMMAMAVVVLAANRSLARAWVSAHAPEDASTPG
jgi:predicted MFS family arabinose efflux permease